MAILTHMHSTRLLVLGGTLLLGTSGCGKKNGSGTDANGSGTTPTSNTAVPGTIAFHVTAGGFNSTAAGASLLGSSLQGLNLTTTAPTGNEYPGIGINSGDAVVEGFKIHLTSMMLGLANPDHGGGGVEKTLFDWSAAPKELQIANGFNGVVDDTASVALDPGTYDTMSIQWLDNYDLKAYAYLDQNNDGTVDATIYTTHDQVVLATHVIAPTDLAALGYDYYHYGFTNLNSKSVEQGPTAHDTTDTTGGITFFHDPVVIAADTKDVSVSLVVAVDRVARVWDGRYGSGNYVAGNGQVPSPTMPFPKSATDSRSTNINSMFPVDKPSFALDYIPIFGFINSPKLSSQAYLVATDNNYIGFNSQTLIVVYDESGAPLLGHTLINDNGISPHLGQTDKGFAKQADGTYTFYSEYGVKNAAGVDDGGYFYSADTTKAGFIISGFKSLAAVGDTEQLTVTDGPRCKEQYNYCVAGSPNDLGIATNPAGTRTVYIKRLR